MVVLKLVVFFHSATLGTIHLGIFILRGLLCFCLGYLSLSPVHTELKLFIIQGFMDYFKVPADMYCVD
jgi:hypothetical protein